MKQIFLTTLLWVALATALPNIGKAQDTSTIDKLLTYIIAPSNKSQISTQYLAEKGTIFFLFWCRYAAGSSVQGICAC